MQGSEEVHEREHRAVPSPSFGFVDSMTKYSSGACAPLPWPRPKCAGGQLQRLAGEHVARVRAGVARPEDRVEAGALVDRDLGADDRRVRRRCSSGRIRRSGSPRCRRSRASRGAP